MQPLVAPRRKKYVPPERDLLYKDHKDVSERTVYILRAWSPDRKRFVPLAAPRQVDTIRSRVGNTHRRAGALTSPPLSSTPIQEINVMQVIHPVCCGIDGHPTQLTACLRRVGDDGTI